MSNQEIPREDRVDILFDRINELLDRDEVSKAQIILQALLPVEQAEIFSMEPEQPQSIVGLSYLAGCADSESIWIATTHGIYRYDYASDTSKQFFPDLHFHEIYRDQDGVIWAQADGRGLLGFDPESGDSVLYTHDPEDPTTISGNKMEGAIIGSKREATVVCP